MPIQSKKDANKRVDQLFQKLNKFIPAYKILAQYVSPFRGLFNQDYSTVGDMIDHKTLIRSYATRAVNIFASGLNSGMTNKATQWFRLTLDDNDLLEIDGVRPWLDNVTGDMYKVINGSNLYDAFFGCYLELGTFGTGCYVVLPDIDDVVRARLFTAGEYMIGVNHKGVVDTFAREYQMTVRQVVNKFGYNNCSNNTKMAFDQGSFDNEVLVKYLIQPNNMADPEKDDVNSMAFQSLYWESGSDAEAGFLAKRGYRRFPVVCPRWEVVITSTDLGYGPSWHSMGTIKELQKTVKDKLMAQEKLHNPPTVQDAAVDGHANLLPGGTTKITGTVPNSGVRPAYQINPNLDSFIELINDEKEEIDAFFFVNLFLALINLQRENKTATEVAAIEQERMMMIGPALHRLDYEMHTPTLELVYHHMLQRGMIPAPPKEIEGMEIKIEFTSILAQAQQAVGITKMERVIGMAERMVGYIPSVADIIDADEVIRQTSEMEGAPAKMLLKKADLQAKREAIAEATQQQQQQAAMPAAAKAAKDASQAKLGENTVLDKMAEGMDA